MSETVDGLRACSKCGVPKCWPASFAKPRGAVCKACRAEYKARHHAETRSRVRAEARAARRRERESARMAHLAVLARRAERKDKWRTPQGNPFDATRVALEAQWGAYATWTRDQHAQHTEILRRMAGLDDETPRAEVAA